MGLTPGRHLVLRACRDCGASLEGRPPNAIYCVPCSTKRDRAYKREYMKRWRARNPEKVRAAREAHRDGNLDRINARRRERYQQHKLAGDAVHQSHVERSAAYRAEHREELREYSMRYRERFTRKPGRTKPVSDETWTDFVVPDYLKRSVLKE